MNRSNEILHAYLQVSRHISEKFRIYYGKLNLTYPQSIVLAILEADGPMPISALAEAAGSANSTISGVVEAALAACPQQARMTSVSGGLTLALPEDAGFEAAFSSMSGEFRSDFPVSGDRGPSGRALYGDGRCKLEFATTSGSMVVARG